MAKGAYVFPKTLRRLRALGARLVNYATDDPFNKRNADGWLRSAIQEYDLYAHQTRDRERRPVCRRPDRIRAVWIQPLSSLSGASCERRRGEDVFVRRCVRRNCRRRSPAVYQRAAVDSTAALGWMVCNLTATRTATAPTFPGTRPRPWARVPACTRRCQNRARSAALR